MLRASAPRLWIAACLFAVQLACGASSVPERSIAVLDIEMTGAGSTASDWTVGLAEFIQAALVEAGLPVYERRDLRYLLSERELGRGALIREEDVAGAKLPEVAYLLKGTVARPGGERFRLLVSVADARSGVEAASLEAAGRYPDEIAAAAQKIAQELATRLGSGPVDQPARAPIPGFTAVPEIAFIHYQGMEHLMAGRPGYAVLCFTQAAQADPDFALARWWKAKAYEQVGLPLLARQALRDLEQTTSGARLLDALGRDDQSPSGEGVIAVMADEALGVPGQLLAASIRRGLAGEPDFTVVEPDWLTRLGAEADLQLTGWAQAPSSARTALWAVTDRVVLVTEDRVADATRQARVVIRDSRTGASLASIVLPGEDVATPGSLVDIAAALRSSASERPAAAEGLAAAPPSSDDEAAWLNHILVELAAGRDRLRNLLRLAPFFGERDEPAMSEAVFENLVADVDPSLPDAAVWYSTALWDLYAYRGGSRGRIGDYFNLLLEKYPEALPTLFCQYSIAVDLDYWKESEKACPLMVEVAEKLPEMLPPELRKMTILGCVYFQAARMCAKAGRTEEAARFIEQATEAVRNAPETLPILHRMGIGYTTNTESLGVIFATFGGNASAEQREGLQVNIERLQRQITGLAAEPAPEPTVEKLGQSVETAFGEEAHRLRIEYIDRVTAGESRDFIDGFRALEFVNWLMARTWTLEQRVPVLSRARELAQRFDLLDTAAYALAIGDYDAARRMPDCDPAQVVRLAEGPPAYARFLVERWRDAPEDRSLEDAAATVEACRVVGMYEEGCEICQAVIDTLIESVGDFSQTALTCASMERLRGNEARSADLLRRIADVTRDGTGDEADIHAAALSELRKLRIDGSIPSANRSWVFAVMPSFDRRTLNWAWDYVMPARPENAVSEIEAELNQILLVYWSCPRGRAVEAPQQMEDAFAARHGAAAVPVLLAALPRSKLNGGSGGLRAVAGLLERVAGEQDKEAILDAFRRDVILRNVAFRLDPDAARAILEEQYPATRDQIWAQGLSDIVLGYQIETAYPILLRSIGDDPYPQLVTEVAQALDRRGDEELKDLFRVSLSEYLAENLRSGPRYRLAAGAGVLDIYEIAARYGIIEGVQSVLQYRYTALAAEEKWQRLRRAVDLPDEPGLAIAILEAKAGLLRWDQKKGKFVLPPGEVEQFAQAYRQRATETGDRAELNRFLVDAILAGDPERVGQLLTRGAEASEAQDAHGRRPMVLAAQNGNAEVLKRLADAGAPVDAEDRFGYTPLCYAAMYGRLEACAFFLDRGARVNVQDRVIGYSPLHHAARRGSRLIVELLLEHGADVTVLEKEGKRPRDLAQGQLQMFLDAREQEQP